MSFRPPRSLTEHHTTSGFNVLDYELASERADALGRHGRKAEVALAALANWSGDDPAAPEREALRQKACEAVWAMFIQREICGLRNDRSVIARYGIPGEVLAGLGVIRKSSE